MKETTFDKESKTARWYKLFWNKDDWNMPKDTCTYYRNTILSFFLIPITFLGLIIHKLNDNVLESFWGRFAITMFFTFGPLLFGLGWYTEAELQHLHIHSYTILWLWGMLSLLIGALGLTLIVLIGWGIHSLVEYCKDKRREKRQAREFNQPRIAPIPKEPNVISAWYKQLKDRTCSKIKWV